MKIELTTEEIQFLLNTLSQVNIPLTTPNAAQLAALGRAVIEKLHESLQSEK